MKPPRKVYTDQTGREVGLTSTSSRIVSLVPSLTELLCWLGLEEGLVGVTKFCTHPINIRKSAVVVGGTKQVHIDRVAALQPDLILCNKEENTREIVEVLSAICPVHVSDIITLADFYEVLQQYGEIFQREQEANLLKTRIRERQFKFKQSHLGKPVRVAYFIWKDPWMLAGKDTFIDEMLREGGFCNVAMSGGRYPVVGHNWPPEWEQPEWVFLSSEPYPFKDKHINEIRELLPQSKVILVDGTWFSWYGSRLPQAFDYMEKLRAQLGG